MAMKFDRDKASEIFRYGVFKEAFSMGAISSRVPTEDMTQELIEKCMSAMKKAGLHPYLHESSKEGGQVIQVTGGDAINLMAMRRGLLASETWQEAEANDGTAILRTPSEGMHYLHRLAIKNALKSEKLTPIERLSKDLGETIRVEGADIERLKDLTDRFDPAKLNFIEMPKDDIGKKAMRAFNYVAAKLKGFLADLKPEPKLPEPAPADPKNFARIMPAVKIPKQGE